MTTSQTLCQELVCTTEYLHTAQNLRIVIAGQSVKIGARAEWHPKVRGTDPETGADVGVAYYDMIYGTKADATMKARLLLKHIKGLRR